MKLRPIPAPTLTTDINVMRQELDDMRDLIIGRVDSPISNGILSLMEVADACYSRGKEMEQTIQRLEADGTVKRGSTLYRFRTGELKSFIEQTKSAVTLGSRRVTAAQVEAEMRF